MKTLVLARHAKSSWDEPDLEDHDRPLNERGEHDAPRMAKRLAGTGVRPEVILSSTALRALTTAEIFGEVLDLDVELDERLYGASPATIAAVVAERERRQRARGRARPGDEHARGPVRGGDRAHADVRRRDVHLGGRPSTRGTTAFASAPSTWRFDAPRLVDGALRRRSAAELTGSG